MAHGEMGAFRKKRLYYGSTVLGYDNLSTLSNFL